MLEKLFPHDPKVRWVLIAFVSLLLLAFATRCRSADIEFEAGSAVMRGVTPVIGITLSGPGPKDAGYQCSILLIGSSPGNNNQGAVQCQLVDGFKRVDLGFGVAVLEHDDSYNSGRFQFSLLLAYRFTDRFSVKYRHMSNADTQRPNLGRDLLLISWAFK